MMKSKDRSGPTPPATDHMEFTITDQCGLIAAGKACPGCTAINVQNRGQREPQMDASKIISTLEKDAANGVNLFTLQGGEPLTVKGIHQILRYLSQSPKIDALVYTSSYGLITKEGKFTDSFFKLKAAGFLKLYLLASVDKLILKETDIIRNDGSAFKSFYGLKLMEALAKEGYRDIGIHQTLRSDNLKYSLDLYKWASERNLLYSCCPLVWKPYTSRKRNKIPLENFSNRLTNKNKPKLRKIINYLVETETKRLKKGLPRTIVPSSAFLRLIPEFAPNNLISCREYRNMIRPLMGRDIAPDGKERWCAAQDTYQDALVCQGCHYICLDRGTPGEYWNFEHLAGRLKAEDIRWQNYIVSRKVPGFDQSRRNLIFYQKSPTEEKDFFQA
ncbi:hypothetical protein M1545_03175 [Patescibacteria group bacterium]|nr:hypothetical protein [Patescibacteria group bacterium]